MKIGFSILCAILIAGCGFSKKHEADRNGSNENVPLAALKISTEDWNIDSTNSNGAQIVTRTVKPEKLALLRKSFRVPTLSSVTVAESNGFELYRVHGYPELEASVYIHPKVFISSSMEKGSILGYRTGTKDGAGNDLIEISIPVALVNGLTTSVPVVGGPRDGAGAAISLPANFRIHDETALKTRLGTKLETLPVCPSVFRLSFETKEYWASSPFQSLSTCPINQFFRIKFRAPAAEMKQLLDSAALREETVNILTDLDTRFEYPRKIVELSIDPKQFHGVIAEALSKSPTSGQTKGKSSLYSIQDLEEALTTALFKQATEAGQSPQASRSLGTTIHELISNYFSEPVPCQSGGLCRAPLSKSRQNKPVQYTWMETENLSSALQTQTLTALGSVANSSRFLAKPDRKMLEKVRRPSFFRGKSFTAVIKECVEMVAKDPEGNPGASDAEKEELQKYCRTISEYSARDDGDVEETDGYFPLGNNTVVYPGAWLRIDVDEIAEFTTAKTKTSKDGTIQIQSQVIDLLEGQPGSRTQCVEGSATACREYKKKTIQVRDRAGDPVFEKTACPKEEEGKNGCKCEKKEGGTEECFRQGQYVLQEVLDFECDAANVFEYCPYWRTEETVIGHKMDQHCEVVKTESTSSFLCLGDCGEKHELHCTNVPKEAILAPRQVLNCIEDENERFAVLANHGKKVPQHQASAHRVRECRRPQYKCAPGQWDISCTKYSVNEAFHVVHEDIVPKWRPFALEQGEFPQKFEEQIYLKFASPGGHIAKNCRLADFPRELRGSTLYIKIPSEKNEDGPCDVPLWDESNTDSAHLPKVYVKNSISYPEDRLCGRTEYSFLTKDLPLSDSDGLIPPKLSLKTQIHVGPVAEACLADRSFKIGNDLWFREMPPIRFSGRVSVLGRMLESILTESRNQ